MDRSLVVDRGIKDISYALASFLMTILRLVMVTCTGIAILTRYPFFKEITISCILLVMVLDIYDGILFNKSLMAEEKYWRIKRRLFDSFADRIIVQIGCISLLMIDKAFFLFYLVILAREIIVSGYCVSVYKKNILIYPKKVAKLAAFMVAATIIIYLTTNFFVTSCTATIMFLLGLAARNEYKNSLKSSGYDLQSKKKHQTIIEVL